MQLHEKLCEARGESREFVASNGWLWRFSQRHGIRQLLMQGEKLSSDVPAATDFIASFEGFIEENMYTLNQIFNCDETGLYYKLLPQKTLASSFEKAADGRKKQKDRVTINACSNILGTIKLPLLLIGKYKNPRCFKNDNRDVLPVKYAHQSNAWMNASIFADWFHNEFVSTVQKKLVDIGVEPKAVLLLDNCSAHPNEEDLISKDKKVIVKYLPPNVTALIQPMDQGVLESLKRRYRRKILEELLFRDEEGVPIPSFLKSINMLKVSNLIASSWNEISPKTLQLSWKKILPSMDIDSPPAIVGQTFQATNEPTTSDAEMPIAMATEEQVDTDESGIEFQSLFQQLGHILSEDEVSEWLTSDLHDNGYLHLSDDGIVSSVIEQHEESDEESDCEANL